MTKKIFILFKKQSNEAPIINRLYVLERREDNYGYVDSLKFEELSSIISNVFGDLGLESLPALGFSPERISVSEYYDLNLSRITSSNIYLDNNISLAFDYLQIANDFASQGISIPLSIGDSSERLAVREIDQNLIIFIYPDDTLDYEFQNKTSNSNDMEILSNETAFYDELGQINFHQYLQYNEDLEYNGSLKSANSEIFLNMVIMDNDENCPADASNDTSQTTTNTDPTIVFTSTNVSGVDPRRGFQLLTVNELPSV